MPEIVITEDGSHTLYNSDLREHYHSVHGAIQESDLIYIDAGLRFSQANPVRIFEVGFGTGLNAFLTSIAASGLRKKVFYTSIEKYPLSESIINSLNYKYLAEKRKSYLFERIHSCKWNISEQITKKFSLCKLQADILTKEIEGCFDLIYFDAFGPDKQPEMWTETVFEKISGITVTGGIFVTYSAKGTVQRMLKRSGFEVTLLPGPPGKHHIIRAVKK
jgi:tRNA U34 5-methylaminomethyl-2-thiouridine-forming methyltransferase MnmC